jgi:hypothetical protein
MGFRFERWTLQLATVPRISRYCPQCKRTSTFHCSERFRVNAQKKTLDVWLLYRCVDCELTWKLPVLSRCHVANIERTLRERFESNDAATAQHFARDVGTLNGYSLVCDPSDIRVTRTPEHRDGLRADTIKLEILGICDIRLDRLIAQELGIERACLNRLYSGGRLLVHPAHPAALARRAQHAQEICILDGLNNCREGQ